MTGFAETTAEADGVRVTVQLSSVNSRYFELSANLPEGLEQLEPLVRKTLSERFGRGSHRLRVRCSGEQARTKLNRELYLSLITELKEALGESYERVDPALLLNLPGVLAQQTPDSEPLKSVALDCFRDAVGRLDTERSREGKAMAKALGAILQGITSTLKKLEGEKGAEAEARRRKVHELAGQFDFHGEEGRVAAEVSLMLSRLDVSEELSRIRAHVDAFGQALKEKTPVGKRIEFLCQELGREANTIASKSAGAKAVALALMVREEAEKLRELARNVE